MTKTVKPKAEKKSEKKVAQKVDVPVVEAPIPEEIKVSEIGPIPSPVEVKVKIVFAPKQEGESTEEMLVRLSAEAKELVGKIAYIQGHEVNIDKAYAKLVGKTPVIVVSNSNNAYFLSLEEAAKV